jgi:hypothetical protein
VDDDAPAVPRCSMHGPTCVPFHPLAEPIDRARINRTPLTGTAACFCLYDTWTDDTTVTAPAAAAVPNARYEVYLVPAMVVPNAILIW